MVLTRRLELSLVALLGSLAASLLLAAKLKLQLGFKLRLSCLPDSDGGRDHKDATARALAQPESGTGTGTALAA